MTSTPSSNTARPKIRTVLLHSAAQLPTYAVAHDAGADLVAVEPLVLGPGQRGVAHTGIAIELPPSYVGLVMPRSGLAVRHGVTVLNAPGVIDAGYRGEIMVPLINTDAQTSVELAGGDRIAQLLIQHVAYAHFEAVSELSDSDRGQAGFGSTGGLSVSHAAGVAEGL